MQCLVSSPFGSELVSLTPGTVPWNKLSPAGVVDSPAHKELAVRAAHEGITLLKNNGILPIRDPTTRVAVIGPHASFAYIADPKSLPSEILERYT